MTRTVRGFLKGQVTLCAPLRAFAHGELASLAAVCAGINLNLPVVGRVLRGLGAFFIRRKFTGLPDSSLYREVLAGAAPRSLIYRAQVHPAWPEMRCSATGPASSGNQPGGWLRRVRSSLGAPEILPHGSIAIERRVGVFEAEPKP